MNHRSGGGYQTLWLYVYEVPNTESSLDRITLFAENKLLLVEWHE